MCPYEGQGYLCVKNREEAAEIGCLEGVEKQEPVINGNA